MPGPSGSAAFSGGLARSEEHTSELQSRLHLVCRLLLEKTHRGTCRSNDASDPLRVGVETPVSSSTTHLHRAPLRRLPLTAPTQTRTASINRRLTKLCPP